MDDNGTYLGNIYGIYKECITNISIDIYDITINIHQYIHQTHRRRLRRRPNGAAAFGGRPIGSVFLIILYHISVLQAQVLLNPGFGKAIGNSLHFLAKINDPAPYVSPTDPQGGGPWGEGGWPDRPLS